MSEWIIQLQEDAEWMHRVRLTHDVQWKVDTPDLEYDEFLELITRQANGSFRTIGSILMRQPFRDFDLPNDPYSTESSILTQSVAFYYSFDHCCPDELMAMAVSVAQVVFAERMAVTMPVMDVEKALAFHASCHPNRIPLKRACELVLDRIYRQNKSKQDRKIAAPLAKQLWERRSRLQRYFHIELPLSEPETADPCL
jgi:hypothetical protein